MVIGNIVFIFFSACSKYDCCGGFMKSFWIEMSAYINHHITSLPLYTFPDSSHFTKFNIVHLYTSFIWCVIKTMQYPIIYAQYYQILHQLKILNDNINFGNILLPGIWFKRDFWYIVTWHFYSTLIDVMN